MPTCLSPSETAAYFLKLSDNTKMPQSIILAGQNSLEAALAIAKTLINQPYETHHPDLFIYKPEGKSGIHPIEAIRAMQEEVYLPPYQAAKKVFIIYEAQKLAKVSANALLKTFEEPANSSFILLTTPNFEKILPTLQSRAQIFVLKAPVLQIKEYQNHLTFLLSQLSQLNYLEIMEKVEKIVLILEQQATSENRESNDHLGYEPSVWQKQVEEKQMEGHFTLKLQEGLQEILKLILTWYRDLHVLAFNGPIETLTFDPSILQISYEQGLILPLELVEGIIKNAQTVFERSNGLLATLESAFLQLQQSIRVLA